jgi:uridine kinase
MASETTRKDTGNFMELGGDEILVVDSIFASHGKLLEAGSLRPSINVFLYAPAVVRLARRLKRDIAERNISVEHNLASWANILYNEKVFIQPLASKADMFINLVGREELDGLEEEYARILAREWAEHGKSEALTDLFERMIRASLESDENFLPSFRQRK